MNIYLCYLKRMFFRYFIPLYPFVFGMIAVASNRLLSNKQIIIKKTVMITILFLLLAGAISNMNYLTLKNVNISAGAPGYSNVFLGSTIYKNVGGRYA